jgi:steroid delta-isomerase-like uncharacterized protein
MDTAWLDQYVDAWLLHPLAGRPEGNNALKTFLGFLSPDVRYEDVPSASAFIGHDGIKQMCEAAHQWSSDLEIHVLTRQTSGSLYALETEASGTHTGAMGALPATGRSFVLRGVSIGEVSSDGLVREQRDYWDLGGFLMQIGVLPPPA